jgi:hypothetical protein
MMFSPGGRILVGLLHTGEWNFSNIAGRQRRGSTQLRACRCGNTSASRCRESSGVRQPFHHRCDPQQGPNDGKGEKWQPNAVYFRGILW